MCAGFGRNRRWIRWCALRRHRGFQVRWTSARSTCCPQRRVRALCRALGFSAAGLWTVSGEDERQSRAADPVVVHRALSTAATSSVTTILILRRSCRWKPWPTSGGMPTGKSPRVRFERDERDALIHHCLPAVSAAGLPPCERRRRRAAAPRG